MASTTTIDIPTPDGAVSAVLALAEFTDHCYCLQNVIPAPGGQYTFSVWARAEAGMQVILDVLGDSFVTEVTTEWTKIVRTVGNAANVSISIYPMEDSSLYLYQGMLQKGQFDTDWKPAPEDMATSEAVEDAQASADIAQGTADEAQSRVAATEAVLQQLSDSISMLVTDKNGTSLMTQTGTGWTFSTSELQEAIDDARQSLADLTASLGDAQAVINVIQQTVTDHGTTLDYINLGTYESEPCIELGESDSDFKLLITNTRIIFMFGSTRKTYIDSDGMTSDNVTIENELRQGDFVWRVRSNGNYGLQYKG